MISGDSLITAVEPIGNKVRIWFGGRYEEYSAGAWVTVSKFDNAGNRIIK